MPRGALVLPQQELFPRANFGRSFVPSRQAHSRPLSTSTIPAELPAGTFQLRASLSIHPRVSLAPCANGHIPGYRVMTSHALDRDRLFSSRSACLISSTTYNDGAPPSCAFSHRLDSQASTAPANLAYSFLILALGLFELKGVWGDVGISVPRRNHHHTLATSSRSTSVETAPRARQPPHAAWAIN